ncbi:MAG: chemotaxis protein CheA, partial [Desulfobacterales bacterium]|nr:chemotaxis protein CheA [Desulfobacterales bacterium]
MDLISDLQSMDKELAVFLEDLESTGTVIARRVDTDAVGLPGDPAIPKSLPFEFIFATILQPADVNMLLDLDEQQIFHITPDLGLLSLATGQPPKLDPVDTASEIPADPVSPPAPVTPFSELSLEEADAAAAATAGNAAPASPAPVLKKAPPVKKPATGGADTSLRINVSLLDSLMNLAGELVLGRNQLLQALSSADQRLSSLAGQRIDLITSELQEAIMLTRMQPIGIVFNKYPRVVRDLSRQLAKSIELDVEGKTVELDKTIIEAINDPLTHLVRNAVDHGIETPDARRAAGKPETGRVALKAYHAAGQVNIEISDDGKGLDGDKLAAVALSKGLITEEQVRAMSAREKVNLIFLPGFSTAEKVSDVSGRGVGMDVVKTNLDKLGGHTDIDSTPGVGSTIRIKLPLTLAIIPSQIVIAEDERYAIPQVNLVELLRVPADKAKERIEKVGEAEVIRLRGNLLPLVRLADLFGVQRTYCDPESGPHDDRRDNIADRRSKTSPLTDESPEEPRIQPSADDDFTRQPGDRRYRADSALNIAVVSAGVFKYGLIVDRLLDSEEIVVKPLGRHLKQCKGYAGATIMGDGR